MADISNRTLAIMMVVAILVSLGGLFISLDRLSKLQAGQPPTITGFTSTGWGKANVSIASLLSITLIDDNLINFGTCTLSGTDKSLYLESNWTCFDQFPCTSMNITPGNGTCVDAGNAPDNITVRNDGNQPANVTVYTNAVANTIFTGGNGLKYLGYKTINESSTDRACGYDNTWWNMTALGSLLSVNYTGNNGFLLHEVISDFHNFGIAGKGFLVICEYHAKYAEFICFSNQIFHGFIVFGCNRFAQ